MQPIQRLAHAAHMATCIDCVCPANRDNAYAMLSLMRSDGEVCWYCCCDMALCSVMASETTLSNDP